MIAGVLLAARRLSRGAGAASGCGRSSGSGRRPTRSPPATSRGAWSGRRRRPRSAGWGWRSTRCSGGSRRRSPSEASEDRLRRFLADASHELRTPLASIRGYAELFRIGAAREPEDADTAMTRIEEEAARMGVLVEDLLTLARLDEVRDRPAEAVDVTQLAEDAAADARAIDPDRAIEVDAGDAAIVLGDADQLRQVLANLMGNALVHTPAGTPIEVAVRARRRRRSSSRCATTGPACPTERPERAVRALLARRAAQGRERGRRRRRPRAGDRRRHRRRRTAAACGPANAPGGGASFVVRLPLAS